jgi:hypothetical protein
LVSEFPVNPESLAAFEKIPALISTIDWGNQESENTVKHDSGRNDAENRFIILSTQRHLDLMSTMTQIADDGTFRIAVD